jgi:hypothetical protein
LRSPRLVGTGIAAGRDFGWFCYKILTDGSIEVGKWQYFSRSRNQEITLERGKTRDTLPFVSITLTEEQQRILGVSRPSIQVHENAADLFEQALSKLPQAQSQYQRHHPWNSRIPARSGYYTLPSTGTYIIEVTSYSENATGSYTLSLSAAGARPPSPPPTPPPSPPSGCTTTAISIGQTVSGALTTSDGRSPIKGRSYYCDRYTFSGTAGQQVAIQLTSSAFDTSLYLIGPSGRVLTYDNDYAGGRLILSYGGTVALRLMRTSNEVSYHSWGIAIDINSAECPQPSDPDCAGGRNRFLYEKVFGGWKWGGTWPRPYTDPMHFELPVERVREH